MKTKVILAALGGGIISFLLGWLIFGVLAAGYYEANMVKYNGLMKNPPDIWLILVANVVSALLLALIFDRWASITTFGSGLMNGMLIGFLVVLSFDLFLFATLHLYPLMILAMDVVLNTLLSGVTGGVVALILGYGKK